MYWPKEILWHVLQGCALTNAYPVLSGLIKKLLDQRARWSAHLGKSSIAFINISHQLFAIHGIVPRDIEELNCSEGMSGERKCLRAV